MSKHSKSIPDQFRCHPKCVAFGRRSNSLLDIIDDYRTNHLESSGRELKSFQVIRTIEGAIERAGLALTPSGKRFDHQRRLTQLVLDRATARLLANKSSIASSKTFSELLNLIRTSVKQIPGIGELYIYDTSLRIGAKLGLSPEVVYLHAGTREGAKRLGLKGQFESIEVHNLPKEFRKLDPAQVEDILCIYKNVFR